MELSAAADRMFDYPAPRVQDNELFSQFKYTPLKGLDNHDGDGTITRRDPSRPILVDGQYHVWYTKRDTATPPIGASRASEATDTIPSTDWDLCEVWHATSADGFTWEEQGVAVARPPQPIPGWRSVATPEILVWKGKYYLYYQAFVQASGLKGDWCAVSISTADSPNGPWTAANKTIIHTGEEGDWDQDAVHDPFPVVYQGRIHVYYKAAYNKWPDVRDKYAVGHGLAVADDPLGPYQKHRLNPVMTSGHETTYFPFKKGIAALAIKDGNERDTIQYADDGVNFRIASVVSLPPIAAGPFTPDAFTNSGNGRGITWGLCHFTNAGTPGKGHSILARFDCDLSLDWDDPSLKRSGLWFRPDIYFKQALSGAQRKRIAKANDVVISGDQAIDDAK
ncbi:Glycosyl hydrolases family 43 [Neorhodopirellula lusitana]|uniref:Glycosyl hydrolases family 43 n=1 Tax=Neorhodopirellula lusitana TaxID=445327 RepID=A0ABY1PSM1_9BACT|nr:glycoside hydrolase [Neorhodopirellula lusitana]SMP42134.1 Glycosyl hydrolases family 43 [Neorhodopirellula lusitana]